MLDAAASVCRACPRLVAWREEVARTKRRSFADEPYWGRPGAGWGDDRPAVLVVGLAPAAHGGNRTGRVFTGDRSGDWLFAALHRVGLATQPTSTHAGDGQRLVGARMVAPVRCAPPANKPTTERARHLRALARPRARAGRPTLRVVVALGAFAWEALLAACPPPPGCRSRGRGRGSATARRSTLAPASAVTLLGSYHPSQQNTFTGRLTEPMLDAVLARAADLR